MPSVGKAWEVTFVNGAGEHCVRLGVLPFSHLPENYLSVKPRWVVKQDQVARALPPFCRQHY